MSSKMGERNVFTVCCALTFSATYSRCARDPGGTTSAKWTDVSCEFLYHLTAHLVSSKMLSRCLIVTYRTCRSEMFSGQCLFLEYTRNPEPDICRNVVVTADTNVIYLFKTSNPCCYCFMDLDLKLNWLGNVVVQWVDLCAAFQLLSLNYCLCGDPLHGLPMMWVPSGSLFSCNLPKTCRQGIGYHKLLLGLNECAVSCHTLAGVVF